ncbi:glycosyltransferase [Agromyces sp. NPDC056379]|uniref:glycosyltransferase n=1 Tax=unclassified Agromyces TaxID=2639701 RepID=UPI0035E0450F
MSPSTIAGVVACFEPNDLASFMAVVDRLSLREQRLAIAAANFRALCHPATEIELILHRGNGGERPRLTSAPVHRHDDIRSRPVIGTLRFRAHSAVAPVVAGSNETFHALISPDTAMAEDDGTPMSAYWRLRQRIEHRFPLQYDLLRQRVLARRERGLHSRPLMRRPLTDEERAAAALPVVDGQQRAVLVGLHWLDLGGAERWAVETVKLVRDAGFLPIVVTDRESHQPWITRPEFDGAVVIPLSFPLDEPGDESFLRAILGDFDIAGVIVHHCAWLYDRLPLIKTWCPGVPVVDSLHIIEYAGGGYPASGVHLDPYIDLHHVISPQLADWLTGPQQVASEKVVLAPLVGLTVEQQHSGFVDTAGDTLRLGFVGRLVRQKRPYLFLKLLRRLHDDGVPIRAIMHGSGELEGTVRQRIHDYGLDGLVELRDHEAPVSETLAEIDLLVVSSQNEGITLTTFEALAAGVPVLSADVGSQDTIVHDEMLVPRAPHGFVDDAAAAIAHLATDPEARREAWEQEMARARAFSAQESATEWMRRTLQAWNA